MSEQKGREAFYIIPGALMKIRVREASHDVYMLDKTGEYKMVYRSGKR